MFTVTSGRDVLGFIIARGPRGYEAYSPDEVSLGLYPSRVEAADAFGSAIRLDADNPALHYELGNALFEQAKVGEAQAEFDVKGAGGDPRPQVALERGAGRQAQQGDETGEGDREGDDDYAGTDEVDRRASIEPSIKEIEQHAKRGKSQNEDQSRKVVGHDQLAITSATG